MSEEFKARRCPACGTGNPADEALCVKCMCDISQVSSEPLEVTSTDKSASHENEIEDLGGDRLLCPECGAELDIQKHYPGCRRLTVGYQLVWKDTSLPPLQLTRASPAFIGRVPPVQADLIRYIEDAHKTVSRNHAELFVGEDGNLYLRDMNSINGTFINGRKILPFVHNMLTVGDELSFSQSFLAKIL